MSFRQFPATDANGDSYVIVEFRDEHPRDGAPADDTAAHVRYELSDGRHLVRNGQHYTTAGGELTLSVH